MEDIQKFVPLWGEWEIKELQGQGAFGSVYRAEKKQFGRTYVSAIKHLSIPRTPMEAESLVSEGIISEPSQISRYYNSLRDSIIKEIDMCYTLKGYTNIVSYEDHLILPKKDIFGYDIFIRMEYLTALTRYITLHTFTERDILRLGIDICTALEVLFQRNIIHRDIKPANVFVNDMGDFKLGDFGESRMMSHTATRMSIKGTYSYMSPEVAMGRPANITADIYSLGIMLYRLMNNNRLPFLSDGLTTITNKDIEKANVLRFSGKRLSLPVGNGNSELVNIIMRACEFQPKDRWQTPTEMKEALEKLRRKSTSQTPVLSAKQPQGLVVNPISASGNSVRSVAPVTESSVSLQNRPMAGETSVSNSVGRVGPVNSGGGKNMYNTVPTKAVPAVSKGGAVPQTSVQKIPSGLERSVNTSDSAVFIPTVIDKNEKTKKPQKSKKLWVIISVVAAVIVLSVVGIVVAVNLSGNSREVSELSSSTFTTVDFSDLISGIDDSAEESKSSTEKSWIDYSAEESKDSAENSGTYNGVAWNLKDGVLTISGSGEITYGMLLSGYINKVTRIIVKDNTLSFGEGCFGSYEKLKSVSIPDGITMISDWCFSGCSNLTEIALPDSMERIGYGSFYGCVSLKEMKIPETVISIAESAFSGCGSLTSVSLPDSIKRVGANAFSNCYNLSSVTLSKNNTSILAGLFSGCSNLTEIVIPEGVTIINHDAFSDCKKLSSVTIPATVSTIQTKAFSGCESLTTITIPNPEASIADDAFETTTTVKMGS